MTALAGSWDDRLAYDGGVTIPARKRFRTIDTRKKDAERGGFAAAFASPTFKKPVKPRMLN